MNIWCIQGMFLEELWIKTIQAQLTRSLGTRCLLKLWITLSWHLHQRLPWKPGKAWNAAETDGISNSVDTYTFT